MLFSYSVAFLILFLNTKLCETNSRCYLNIPNKAAFPHDASVAFVNPVEGPGQ
jgi:hypothetical protein